MGRTQAEYTGKRLRELGLPYTSMVRSTMARAQETAEIIAKSLPQVGRKLKKKLAVFKKIGIEFLILSEISFLFNRLRDVIRMINFEIKLYFSEKGHKGYKFKFLKMVL